jgi:transposase-like protein
MTKRGTSRPRLNGHLTIADVCDELEISRSTFYEWRAKHTAATSAVMV